MIELNEEQRRAVAEPATPPHLIGPHTEQEYVLVRAEVYARWQVIIDGATKRAGRDDPGLDVYEAYRKVS